MPEEVLVTEEVHLHFDPEGASNPVECVIDWEPSFQCAACLTLHQVAKADVHLANRVVG